MVGHPPRRARARTRIIPVTFVISLFNDNVSIYEVDNNGNWYDFGFMLGIAGPFSGIGGGASRARR